METSIFDLITGGTAWQIYLIASAFSLLGALINTYRNGLKGAKKNPNSPKHFDWGYLWKDTWPKIISSVLSNLLLVRFQAFFIPEDYKQFVTTDIVFLVSLVNGAMGYGIDWFFQIIREKTTLLDTKKQ